MIKAYYQLVRDKVPDIIKKKNMTPVYRKLNETEFKYYLKLKLKEEMEEMTREEDPTQVAKNLVDILEVIKYLKKEYKISDKQLKKLHNEKIQEKGLFDKKLFLVLTDE